MAEFETPAALVEAAHHAREAGYTKLDAYTPYPIEALTEALDIHDRRLPAVVLGGGILGGLCGYALCYWTSVLEYPMNIGGKPFHSAPAFIVPTFECTILFAAFAAVLGMLGLNGLPMPYHPCSTRPASPGLARPLLPVHRVEGPQVRPRRDLGLPDEAGTAGRDGRGGMNVVPGPRSQVPGRGAELPSWDLGLGTSDRKPRRHWALIAATILAAACRQDMQDQPKYKDLRGSAFFEDGRSARPVVEDTVARGALRRRAVTTGKDANGQPVASLPAPLTALMERGRDRCASTARRVTD
jgi:hypothetical protein